jgi:ubiquinone/menaquinone biosynthesis C-methylase UbiE
MCAMRSRRRVNDADLTALLERGVQRGPFRWAELGAGEGNFTKALAGLLGPGAHITAVDRDRGALEVLRSEMGRTCPGTGLEVQVADFTTPLHLNDLDGIVMANSLHFVSNKQPVLEAVREMLKPGGRLIVVEYGTDRGNPWVPHPFSYETWQRMSAEADLVGTELIGTVPSRYFGSMYSALSLSRAAGEGQRAGPRKPGR